MIERIRADESLQVLVFIVLPLVLLLVGIVIRGALQPSRYVATFPTFSVTLVKLARDSFGREEGYVMFREETRQVEFIAEIVRSGTMYVQAPGGLSEEDLLVIVPKLAQGLEKMRYKYIIYRKGEPQRIKEEEREAAIAELRQLGFAIEDSTGQGELQKAVTHHWRRASGKEAIAKISRVQSLMSKARGVRETIEVLASNSPPEG
jgi:hypothetical protein